MVHRREASGPNAICPANRQSLDVLLVRRDGEPAKPRLTIVLDDYSRAMAGYFLFFEVPSIPHWREEDPRWNVCGIPEIISTDDGSDFTSCHLEQVGADTLSFCR